MINEKFRNNEIIMHEVENPQYVLESVGQFFSDLKEEITEKRVRNAMILKVHDPNVDVEYSLKCGGGSMSDSLFEAIIKVDGDAIMKKYSTTFDKVQITFEDIKKELEPLIPIEDKILDRLHLIGIAVKHVAFDRLYGENTFQRKFGEHENPIGFVNGLFYKNRKSYMLRTLRDSYKTHVEVCKKSVLTNERAKAIADEKIKLGVDEEEAKKATKDMITNSKRSKETAIKALNIIESELMEQRS